MSGTTRQRRATELLRRHSHSFAAVLSNGVAAASSFALQLVAARALGAAGLGRFSLLTASLITVASLQSGWIGDSLTVLDRFSPPIRAALIRSQQVAVALAMLIGAVVVAATGIVGVGGALGFGLALALWLLEDTGRRLLMARQEFWQAVLNDGTYAVAALSFVAATVLLGHDLTLASLVWAMAIGSGAACLAAVVQLPRHELLPPPAGTRADLSGLSSFAVWRAAQVGLRPGGQFIMRTLVAASASAGALGRLEGARLLLAPVAVVINGAGFFLLPTYSERLRRGTFSMADVRKAMVVLPALALATGAVALAAAPWVGPLITGGSFELSAAAVISWTLLMAGLGAGIPCGLALVASGRPRQTFLVRTADSGVGLALAAVVAAAGLPQLAPAALAAGAFLGAGWMLHKVREAIGTTGSAGSEGRAPNRPSGC